MVLVRMWVDGPDDELAMESLYQWIRDDPDAGAVPATLVSVGDGQHMGGLDVIQAVVPQVTNVAGLVLAYLSWRNSRPTVPEVRITLDGRTLTVDARSPESVERIVAGVLRGDAERAPAPVSAPGPDRPDPADVPS